jgi:hypothetical protein
VTDWTEVEARFDGEFRNSALAEPATYTSYGGTPRAIRGVMNPTSLEMDAETSALVRTNRVVFSVLISDLEAPPDAGDDRDEITVRGVDYLVVDAQLAGATWADLMLHVKSV